MTNSIVSNFRFLEHQNLRINLQQEAQLPQTNSASAAHMEGGG